MRRVLVLVEGQTEEAFLNRVLRPALASRHVFPIASLLRTKEPPAGKPFKGGITTFARIERDVRRLLSDQDAIVTTLLDYYGLPDDFPEIAHAPMRPDVAARVLGLQDAFARTIDHGRFRPFLALHEFEAWLFAVPQVVEQHFQIAGIGKVMAEVSQAVGGPERINDGLTTHPSRRLEEMTRGLGRQAYGKVLDGPSILERSGLAPVREICPHFAGWFDWLGSLSPDGST